ncbi:MAG: hypothetical protein AB8G14_03650 [Ilumatobacter sp.]
MSQPPPPSFESVLDRFLVDSPPHPIELHVTDEIQRRGVVETIGDGVLTDVVHAVAGTEPMPDGERRQIRVEWAQPGAIVASVVFDGARQHHEILRRTLLAARRHRCVVRSFRRGGLIAGRSGADVFYAPRVVRPPGKLGPHARIVDSVERFDVMFGKFDHPGRLARTVMRRSTFEETWRVVLDAEGLRVQRVKRSGDDDVRVPLSELVAAVKSPWETSSGPTQSILTTNEVLSFPRLSFLGRSFGLNANDAWDFEQFVVQRINQRLGV